MAASRPAWARSSARWYAEGAWAAPVAGGSVVDQWAAIAPAGVADHLVPVRFDADAGRLDLRPDFSELLRLKR